MKKITKAELEKMLAEHAEWRADHSTGRRAEFVEYELCNIVLPSYCIISGCTVSGCTVSGGTVSYCTVSGGTVSYCTVSGGTVSDCTVSYGTVSGGIISDCMVSGCTVSYCTVSGGTVSGGIISDCMVSGCTVSYGTVSGGKAKILKGFEGLYRYNVWAVLMEDGSRWVRMGCLFKSLDQWEAEGGIRRSNLSEFPDDGSDECKERVAAFEFAKATALRMKMPTESSDERSED